MTETDIAIFPARVTEFAKAEMLLGQSKHQFLRFALVTH